MGQQVPWELLEQPGRKERQVLRGPQEPQVPLEVQGQTGIALGLHLKVKVYII